MSRDEGPAYSLAEAKALVAAGSYQIAQGSSGLAALVLELGSLVGATEFVPEAFAVVSDEDFVRQVTLHQLPIEGVYDEYAFEAPVPLIERFGLRRRCWYLKFKLKRLKGQTVFLLSLHPMNKDEHRRRGGPLRWK